MTHRGRIAAYISAGLLILLLVGGTGFVWLTHTGTFRRYVAGRLIEIVRQSTGGRTDIAGFSFDWSRSEAQVTGLVIHGKETPSEQPFFRASSIRVRVRLIPNFHELFTISYAGIEEPRVNIVVYPDGTTNIPSPPPKATASDTDALETMVDLGIGQLELNRGLVHFGQITQALDMTANNLRVELFFNRLSESYAGRLSMQPIYAVKGKNMPVVASVQIPLVLERNKISITGADVRTNRSVLRLNASILDLQHPSTRVQVVGKISLLDVRDVTGAKLNLSNPKLSVIEVDTDALASDKNIAVNRLRLAFGASSIEGHGELKNAENSGSLDFHSVLNVAQISNLLHEGAQPNLAAFQENIAFDGKARLAGDRLRVNPFQITALDARLEGDASVAGWNRYGVTAQVSGLDFQTVQKRLGRPPLPYSGVASGTVKASGEWRAPAATKANARLNIRPGRAGIPVSGMVNLDYDARSGDIRLDRTTLRLPHSVLTAEGAISKMLQVDLVSQDLGDLLAAVRPKNGTTVRLSQGRAELHATIIGSLSNPTARGHLSAIRLVAQDRLFDSISSDFQLSSSRFTFANGVVKRAMMQASFAGSVGLRNWSPAQNQPLRLEATISNADLADAVALAGQKSAGYSGALTAQANVSGTVGNPMGAANLQIAQGTLAGESFDRLQAAVDFKGEEIAVPSASLTKDRARIDLSANYRHSAENILAGHLQSHVMSSGLNLGDMASLQKQHPGTSGNVNFDITASGDFSQPTGATEFLLTEWNGNVSAKGVRYAGVDYGDFALQSSTRGDTVTYTLTSTFAGSQVRANGRSQLVRDYPSEIDATFAQLPVERVLAAARRQDIPAKGMLSGTINFRGTLENPTGRGQIDLRNATIYEEPIDRLTAGIEYLPESVRLSEFAIAAGPSRLNVTGKFDHPRRQFDRGQIELRVENSRVDLARVRNLQRYRPGLSGTVQLEASAGAALTPSQSPNGLIKRVQVNNANASLHVAGLRASGKSLGNLDLMATSQSDRINFTLNSNLAGSTIHGNGTSQLNQDYQTNAELDFENVKWENFQPLLGRPIATSLDAETSGRITLNGPLARKNDLDGRLRLTSFRIKPMPSTGSQAQQIVLRNDGDIAVKLEKGRLEIESVHLVGPQTEIRAAGSSTLSGDALAITLDGNLNLALLETLNSDVFSSGNVTVQTAVKGRIQNPQVNGNLQLKNASINYAGSPIGLENATGTLAFNANTATIQNMTASSGGGKVTLSGYIANQNGLRFNVRADAQNVRVRAQQGVSVVVSSNLTLTGTAENSALKGTVNIDRLTYAPQTDIGSILTRSAPPIQSPSSPSSLLSNMSLDIQVRTSSSSSVQASLAENLQVRANLRVRGKAAQPSVLGAVNLERGQLVFFGATYRISSGTISFYNPNRIEPILDISLQTTAKGVTVVLAVNGPVDNMKLSYTSDPPLQFEEIVALLAAGKPPTSDPTLLANQPSQPPQTLQQRGGSALLSKALADPLSSRLERVFGVSQLKIDPSFTSGSQLPQARVTLQQQVSSNLVFTYVTALDNPNTQVVRIEWSMTPQWAAAANRDENGLFSINLLYKRQFR